VYCIWQLIDLQILVRAETEMKMTERPPAPRWFMILFNTVVVAMALAAYLNIGWAIGTYYHNYITGHTPQTFWQTVWGGGWEFFSRARPADA